MKDFILPDIGEGIVECEIMRWHVAEGDSIKEDQLVAEVMTDKATVEIPAMNDGVVGKLYYKEGDIAKVHMPLFAMQSEDSPAMAETPEPSPAPEPATDNAVAATEGNATTNAATEPFILPDIGEGIVECEIMQWHIAEGDVVAEDQVVVEVMTDKAVVEIPAKHAGKITKLHHQKGEIARVHTPLFEQILDNPSASASAASSAPAVSVEAPVSAAVSPSSSTDNKQQELFEPPVDVSRALASPAVRRLARENNIDLSTVAASGKKGRVLKQDVVTAISSRSSAPHSGANNVIANETSIPSANIREDKTVAVKGIQAAMAKQMQQSVYTIPHFSVSDELNMNALIELRAKLKPEFADKGIKLSFLPFFIKALSLAMLEFPILNSRLSDDGSELTYLGSHNIGLAVDSKIGLLVPNIKSVETLSLFEVAQALSVLIDKARDGKLSNTDLSGGTISISNIGAIGGTFATPVINKPEVAIVALGKTQKLPRFDENGAVTAVNIMNINWSGDHRVIDGATMVKFNNLWMDYLSQPEKMLINLR